MLRGAMTGGAARGAGRSGGGRGRATHQKQQRRSGASGGAGRRSPAGNSPDAGDRLGPSAELAAALPPRGPDSRRHGEFSGAMGSYGSPIARRSIDLVGAATSPGGDSGSGSATGSDESDSDHRRRRSTTAATAGSHAFTVTADRGASFLKVTHTTSAGSVPPGSSSMDDGKQDEPRGAGEDQRPRSLSQGMLPGHFTSSDGSGRATDGSSAVQRPAAAQRPGRTTPSGERKPYRRSALDRWITEQAKEEVEREAAEAEAAQQHGESKMLADQSDDEPSRSEGRTALSTQPLPSYMRRTFSRRAVATVVKKRRQLFGARSSGGGDHLTRGRPQWTEEQWEAHRRRMRVWRIYCMGIGMFQVLYQQLAFRQKLFGTAQVAALTIDEARDKAKEAEEARLEAVRLERRGLMGWWARHLFYPSSTFKRWWDIFFLLMLFWVTIRVPLIVSFEGSNTPPTLDTIDTVAEYGFVVDIVLSFFTVYMEDGDPVDDPELVIKHYATGWFPFDCIASFPYTVIVDSDLFRGMKLMRLSRLAKMEMVEQRIIDALDLGAKRQHQLRLLKLGFYCVVCGHIAACMWYYIASLEGHGDYSWTQLYLGEETFGPDGSPNAASAYVSALYWAAATLTTVGYGDVSAHTDAERGFALLMIVVGALIFASMVGKMVQMANAMYERERALQTRRTQISGFLRHKKVPRELRTKVREAYEALYRRGLDEDEQQMFADMPPPLRREILYSMHSNLFEQVPVLKYSQIGLQLLVAERLTTVLVLAREYVIIGGEAGRFMYFIRSGSLVSIDSGGYIHRHHDVGSFFGEAAMLDHVPSQESVRAVTDCELLRLSRDDFLDILVDFPEWEQTLRNVVLIRQSHSKNHGGEYFARVKAGVAQEHGGANAAPASPKPRAGSPSMAAAGSTRSAMPAPRKAIVAADKNTVRRRHSGAQTPPVGEDSWTHLRDGLGQFEQRYLTVLRRSRTLQADTYQPKPRSLRRIRLDPSLISLVDAIAANGHDRWVTQRAAAGWQWGPERDNSRQLHPDMIPFDELDDDSRTFNIVAAEKVLKLVVSEGFAIRKPFDSESRLKELMSAVEGSTVIHYVRRDGREAEYVPQPLDLSTVELPVELDSLVAFCSEQAHDTWARQRLDAGWVWGHHCDDRAKTHNLLVPFGFLSNEQRDDVSSGVVGILKMAVALGYTFAVATDEERRAARVPRRGARRRVSTARGGKGGRRRSFGRSATADTTHFEKLVRHGALVEEEGMLDDDRAQRRSSGSGVSDGGASESDGWTRTPRGVVERAAMSSPPTTADDDGAGEVPNAVPSSVVAAARPHGAGSGGAGTKWRLAAKAAVTKASPGAADGGNRTLRGASLAAATSPARKPSLFDKMREMGVIGNKGGGQLAAKVAGSTMGGGGGGGAADASALQETNSRVAVLEGKVDKILTALDRLPQLMSAMVKGDAAAVAATRLLQPEVGDSTRTVDTMQSMDAESEGD